MSTETQPSWLGPTGPPFCHTLGVRSQGVASGPGFPAQLAPAYSLVFRGSGLGVPSCLCSDCYRSGLLASGSHAISNLFCTLRLSPFFVSPSFPSECTAFHSVVLGDTYNIPLDPRGKQQSSVAPSFPSEGP